MFEAKELPGRTFATKSELFKALQENKELIVKSKSLERTSDKTKAVMLDYTSKDIIKEIEVKDGHSLHVINTTNILDSHGDLHVKGIWTKSVREQKGNVYFLVNHQLEVGKVIAYPGDVKMKVINVSFKDLGFDYEGNTQALVFEIDRTKVRHEEARYIIENKIKIEHSIRVSYVKMELAINSEDSEYKEEKKIWDKYYPIVANKEDADKVGYMWIIKEAQVRDEGSMVLRGSNPVTPMKTDSETEEIKEDNTIIEETQEKKDSGNYPFLI